MEALGAIAVALLLWYGGAQIAAGTLTFGALVAFMQYTNRFFLPIRDLGAKYTVMQAAMASAERIFGLLDRAPGDRHAPDGRPAGARGGDATAVAFRDVWFAYDGEQWVLRECAFDIAPGEHVAIVGATGEGKSTCARLLNRSYDVARGRVLVDGVDVREWDLTRLRRHVGIIFQDTVLFTGSVETNLRLGVDGAAVDGHAPSQRHVTAADLERAVHLANATAFVEALPGRLHAPLSERGANISHGQRQLLAIARALVYNPANPRPGRSDLERRSRVRSAHPGRDEAPPGGTDDDHHRPSARRPSMGPTESSCCIAGACTKRERTPISCVAAGSMRGCGSCESSRS